MTNDLALKHSAAAGRALDQGNLERAAEGFTFAIRHAPDWATPWYNLGLVRKLQRRWPESLACNQRATALDPANEAAWWNAGIAATAIGDWAAARTAWLGFGLALPPGDSEPRMDLGHVPIRLAQPDGPIVWCQRIDPARAMVGSALPPSSGYRYGDILLHDGAPRGTQLLGEQEVPIFDMLALLAPSAYRSFAVTVHAESGAALATLARGASDHGLGVEDWDDVRRSCLAVDSAASDDDRQATLLLATLDDDALRHVVLRWQELFPKSVALAIESLPAPADAPIAGL